MFWLKIEKLIVVCSAIVTLIYLPNVMASENKDIFIQLARLANKGEKVSQYKLAMLMLNKASTYYNLESGIKQLTVLAKARHIPAMQYLANYYAISDSPTFRPTKAYFWYQILDKAKGSIDPFLYHFTLLNLGKVSVSELNTLMSNTKNDNAWQRKLLKARMFDLGVARTQSKSTALQLYEEISLEGIDTSHFIRPIVFRYYSPEFEGEVLLKRKYDHVKNVLTGYDYVTEEEIQDPQLKYLSLQGDETSFLRGLGFKVDADGFTQEVTQYFSSTIKFTFTQLKQLYLDRLGLPSKQEGLMTVWNIEGLQVLLLQSNTNRHRLVTRIVGKSQ